MLDVAPWATSKLQLAAVPGARKRRNPEAWRREWNQPTNMKACCTRQPPLLPAFRSTAPFVSKKSWACHEYGLRDARSQPRQHPAPGPAVHHECPRPGNEGRSTWLHWQLILQEWENAGNVASKCSKTKNRAITLLHVIPSMKYTGPFILYILSDYRIYFLPS